MGQAWECTVDCYIRCRTEPSAMIEALKLEICASWSTSIIIKATTNSFTTFLTMILYTEDYRKLVATLCMILLQQIHFSTMALFFQITWLPHFKASTHEVESTNLLSPIHGQFCSDQWNHTNFSILSLVISLFSATRMIISTKYGALVNLTLYSLWQNGCTNYRSLFLNHTNQIRIPFPFSHSLLYTWRPYQTYC